MVKFGLPSVQPKIPWDDLSKVALFDQKYPRQIPLDLLPLAPILKWKPARSTDFHES
jgi:hypothetical protein